jgi:hypothetical protein
VLRDRSTSVSVRFPTAKGPLLRARVVVVDLGAVVGTEGLVDVLPPLEQPAPSSDTTRTRTMRIGRNIEVRPLGGGMGCLAMILFSIIASVVLTILVNLLVR